MYCKQCGKEVMENSVICPNCGARVQGKKAESKGMNWLILVGAVLSVIGTFMPAITFMGESLAFMSETAQTEGFGILVLAIIAGVLGVLPRARKFSFIPAVIMIGVVCVDISPALDKGAQIGIGAMSIILGGILAIVGSIVEFTKKKKSPLA